MLIRREADADVAQVHALVADAFRQPGSGAAPVEVTLLEALRAGPDWLPPLSLVAEGPAGDVVGHVVCSRAWIGDAEVVGLGPLAVRPGEQGRGVGSALMHAVVGAAEALDVPVVALLGSTTYYARFGFRPAHRLGIDSPDPAWGDHFQARLLVPPSAAPRGRFRYASPFTRMDS
jgi:putative acetyltransferase